MDNMFLDDIIHKHRFIAMCLITLKKINMTQTRITEYTANTASSINPIGFYEWCRSSKACKPSTAKLASFHWPAAESDGSKTHSQQG